MNKLVTCPYDEVHKVKESRLSLHIAKCRLNHLDKDKEKYICPFNATHIVPRQEKLYHLENCPERTPLDRFLTSGQDRNNPFRGNTSVPSYTASSVPNMADECWDDAYYAPPPINNKPPPACAIVEPPALAKPAERRKLYQELHRMPTEMERLNKPPSESSQTSTNKPNVHVSQTVMSRQPKALSQVEKEKNVEFQNVGVGRGKPANPQTTKIAATIFDQSSKKQESSSTPVAAPANNYSAPHSNSGNYSAALTAGMSNLGLGRGYSNNSLNNNHLDDEQFPVLGRGRGISKPNKGNGPRR